MPPLVRRVMMALRIRTRMWMRAVRLASLLFVVTPSLIRVKNATEEARVQRVTWIARHRVVVTLR